MKDIIKNMKERRFENRKKLSFLLKVIDTVDNSVLGTIIDISTMGLLIQSNHQLHINEYYSLIIKLPENNEYHKSDIDIYIEPKWVKKGRKKTYQIGCQLIKIKNEDKKIISDIINNN